MAFLGFSCSDDDDSGSSPEDLIESPSEDLIGAWIIIERSADGLKDELDACYKMTFITFNGTQYTFQAFSDFIGDCIEGDSSSIHYTATSSMITLSDSDGDTVFDYSISDSVLTT